MTMHQTLTRIAANGPDRGKIADLKGPQIVIADGNQHLVATDGRVALWMRDSLILGSDDAQKKLLTTFAPPAGVEPVTMSLAAIKTFCGPPLWDVVCRFCRGLSKSDSPVTCAACENSGVEAPDYRPGYVLGIAVDRNRLAQAIDGAYGVDVRVFAGHANGTACIWIIAENWRAAVVRMLDDDPDSKDEWKAAPRLNKPEERP